VRAVHRLVQVDDVTWHTDDGKIVAHREDEGRGPVYRVIWGERGQDYNVIPWLGHGRYGLGVYINSTRTAVILRRDGDALVLEFADADGRSGWLAVPELDA